MNIALCGFMGSGKTCVGKETAKLTGRKFIDTDELIEQEQGTTIAKIFEEHGEDYFRDLEHEMCKKVAAMNNVVISTGGGALTFKRNVDALKQGSKIILLDADFDVICSRIKNADSRPLFKNKENAKKLYDERKAKYTAAADIIVNGNMSARQTAVEIAEMFK